jgi:hypothetical protein
MRQPGLGKITWLEEERGEGKAKKAPKEKKGRK